MVQLELSGAEEKLTAEEILAKVLFFRPGALHVVGVRWMVSRRDRPTGKAK